ncbi:uncharacterized protein LOC107791287 [Nicotiana tabacum]
MGESVELQKLSIPQLQKNTYIICSVRTPDRYRDKPKKTLNAREAEEEEMEKYFGNAYRGDPGVPHADPERFVNIWIGSAAFSALTFINPYMWTLSNQYNWHDKAMLFEQHHWKKALKKNKDYEFKWNQYMDKDARDSYYFNWPVYFP